MAGNKFQIKRTAVTGRAANNSIIDTGELAINITDGIMYSTNGTNVFEIGANLTSLSVSGITYPTTDGTNGQVLTTDGAGNLTFSDASSGGISNVVEDTTPQLGGDLDLNGFDIIGSGEYSAVGNVNITSTLNFVSPDGNNTISVEMLDTDTVSFSGESGELFSVTDSMTGTIYSVNDISGIPSIEVDDDGTIRLAEVTGNVLIGTNVDDGTNKVQVNGNVSATAFSGDGSALTNISYTVTESDVTQHEAALSITESQISDFGTYLTDAPSDGNQYARQDGSWSVVTATGGGDVVDDTTPQLGGDLDLNGNDITGTGNIDITGNITSTTVNLQNSSLTSTTSTLATVTQTPVILFAAADYSSGKVLVQATDTVSGEVHISELLIAHDGTTAYVTEYGVVFTGSAELAEYAVDINSGNVRLLITSASANSTQYNITQTLVNA